MTDQTTPMIYAAATDQWPVVEILINHGADI
ncbi:ankyrin repeat domain-containing protein [Gluconobacter cerinus]|nr:ankyrin repeat domain-containing protein [Gluconobacter cerinus]MBM3099314.1 ankyrin repeat domain-containing protein [Gluconobacter cerinus]